MWNKTLQQVPQLLRGIVWCRICGRQQRIDSAGCLSSGWPTCCGYTMTLDSPEERGEGEQA